MKLFKHAKVYPITFITPKEIFLKDELYLYTVQVMIICSHLSQADLVSSKMVTYCNF